MAKKKKKLLAWCDFLVPTGFGTVSKNLFKGLNDDYDVSVVGINYHGDKRYDSSEYFVYSVSHDDLLGIKRLPKIIEEEQPDILFLFQDIFHISDILNDLSKIVPEHTKIVTYFPVDGEPFSLGWGNIFEKSDSIITYTDWAIDVIHDRFPNANQPISKLYHGVNFEDFYPLNPSDIKKIRQTYGWSGKFVALNLNRFQPRKYIPGTARAFSMFAKGYKQCNKCNHEMPIDRNRCELCASKNLVKKGKAKNDVYLWLHMMPREHSMGPSRANLLQNHLLNAGFEDTDVGTILGVNARNIYGGEVGVKEVNEMYNAANVNISTTLGEGCGLSLIEAQATGTPSIAPRNSAIPEMLRDTGWLVDNITVINQALDNAHMRPIVDIAAMRIALEDAYAKWKENGKGKVIDKACIDQCNTCFRWDDKRAELKSTFEEVLKKKSTVRSLGNNPEVKINTP
jgi:glycosyltransferase involved in cell wall biosynthesis